MLVGTEVEHLVVDADHPAAERADVPAAPDALRRGRRGEVERPRGGRPPVDQQRPVVVALVEQPDPADVHRRLVVRAITVGEVEPAEAQPLLHGLELGEPIAVGGGRRLPFGGGLRRPTRAAQSLGEPAVGQLAFGVEAFVQRRDVRLLGGDLGALGLVEPRVRLHRLRIERHGVVGFPTLRGHGHKQPTFAVEGLSQPRNNERGPRTIPRPTRSGDTVDGGTSEGSRTAGRSPAARWRRPRRGRRTRSSGRCSSGGTTTSASSSHHGPPPRRGGARRRGTRHR